MQERTASVQFDGFETELTALPFAGLAQGSPLSSILFAFYNADLVDQAVDTQGGASAYIDDYFRWTVGKSAEENLDKIQDEDIPRITAWMERTGACFVPEKTGLIHLTRRRKDKGLMRCLASVQRAALLRIISAFRTVAIQTLEVECHALPTRLRLKQRAQDVIARLCTTPQTHPTAKVIERTKRRIKRKEGLAGVPTGRKYEDHEYDGAQRPRNHRPKAKSATARVAAGAGRDYSRLRPSTCENGRPPTRPRQDHLHRRFC